MNEEPENPKASPPVKMRNAVDIKTSRKLAARARSKRSVWFGLGMFGLVGWAVAVPTLIGIALGLWIDHTWPEGRISWTLTFLVVGIFLGCMNAWHWIKRESGHD
ncbi:MAG: AtpZ/AtpI family protein [Gammaproteobacteria bacterium]